MILRTHITNRNRRGMILMVVLALLTLFTIVGITFVYVSDSFATSARLAREAENFTAPDMDPELAASFVLGQLIYDVNDDAIGVQSALRGWSLARNMYGWNNTTSVLNDKAYAGMGRMRNIPFSPPMAFADMSSANTFDMVNYQYHSTDGFVIDPERLNSRNNPSVAQTNPYIPGNVPYTYPDQNNMFVAHLDPASNTIVMPSFSRPWLNDLTSAVGKYKMFRPRQAEHPQFPAQEDSGGDVKNYDGGPGGNDSIWIDPGGPVLTAPNGVKYKMLVAPLILPLDGRINVNTAGNILNTTTPIPSQAGNQGFGSYEVNLAQVMQKDTTFTEVANLFLGLTSQSKRVLGRYGQGGLPVQPLLGAQAPTSGSAARAWAAIDFNGVNDPMPLFPTGNNPSPFSATSSYSLPTTFNPFPFFSGDGYNNGYPYELTSSGAASGTIIHPMLYNPIYPGPGNRNFGANDMAALLRSGGTGSDYLGSDLLRLCPNNLGDPATRNLLTTLSFDLDRPAMVPYVWDRSTPVVLTGNWPFTIQQNQQTGPYNNVAGLRTNPPGSNEFDPATWRSVATLLNKVNLNRTLTSYPPVITTLANGSPAVGVFNGDPTQAIADRASLAQDIFNALQMITGIRNPLTDNALTTANYTNAAQWNALRYLAQISVNLVDYIDGDDYITPFQWTADNPATTASFVFGVELPRLVVNETYVQVNNDPADIKNKMATNPYQFNVWVELLNPLNATTDLNYYKNNKSSNPTNDPEAWFTTTNADGSTNQVYQLLIVEGGITNYLQDPANVTGDPNFNIANDPMYAKVKSPTRIFSAVTDFGTGAMVLPVNGQFNTNPPKVANANPVAPSNGFYVIGPSTNPNPQDDPNFVTNNPIDHQTAGMMYTLNNPNIWNCQNSDIDSNAFNSLVEPTIVLQRLLCPAMIAQPDPTKPLYNPYITVDYVEKTCQTTNINDMRQYTSTGQNNAYPTPANGSAASTYSAMQRPQPYAVAFKPLIPKTPSLTSPQNTFYSHNASVVPAAAGDATLQFPFDWLVHLDRQLISKTELIYASACKPHELTQLFVQNNVANSQNVDSMGQSVWLNPNTLLYRFLEMATIKPWVTGYSPGCRVAGKVNINLMTDPRILNAICDPQPGNLYGLPDVQSLYQTIMQSRQPGYNLSSTFTPGPNDNPLWGFGVGPAQGGDSLSTGPRGLVTGTLNQLMSIPPTNNNGGIINPYQRFEMLNKLTNNITTRSNVYGIWMTFGFFEVVDSTTTPPTLGAEIGKSENRHKRHRAFAIVDRTNLNIFSVNSTTVIDPVSNNVTSVTIPINAQSLSAMSGTVSQSGFNWQIQQGTVLVYEPNTNNEETVVVQSDGNGGFLGTFFKSHPNPCIVQSRGNPGPCTQIPYNPRNDPGVVVYFAVIN